MRSLAITEKKIYMLMVMSSLFIGKLIPGRMTEVYIGLRA